MEINRLPQDIAKLFPRSQYFDKVHNLRAKLTHGLVLHIREKRCSTLEVVSSSMLPTVSDVLERILISRFAGRYVKL